MTFVTLIREGKQNLFFIMKKIKETQGSGFYIFESRATGNSNYIESILEAKRLLTYLNYFLKDFLFIHDYVISRHGFQIAVELNSSEKILSKAKQTKNSINKFKHDEIWKIISEKIRLSISTYVRFANRNRKRKGTLVQEKYSRYYFESKNEAFVFMNRLRTKKMKSYQKKKYRGVKSHYKISSKIAKGSIYLSSIEVKKSRSRNTIKFNYPVFKGIDKLVVLKLIENTINLHSPPFIPPNPFPKSP